LPVQGKKKTAKPNQMKTKQGCKTQSEVTFKSASSREILQLSRKCAGGATQKTHPRTQSDATFLKVVRPRRAVPCLKAARVGNQKKHTSKENSND